MVYGKDGCYTLINILFNTLVHYHNEFITNSNKVLH